MCIQLTVTVETIQTQLDEIKEAVVEWRRYLHQHPELSFQEEKTARFVYETLASFDNLELSRPTSTSVMARLKGAKPGKVVAIRADMDALPIQEENGFSFASQTPGVMHACGHDGHTAMLLGVAKVLVAHQEQLAGEIRFLFQHAEELSPGGAIEMVQAGVMDGVDSVIATHLWAPLETGKIGIVYGETMAAPDLFTIRVLGRGGHGGMPHEALDAIAIGAQVVANLQHLVSRNTDPIEKLVVSITQFNGGYAPNIIPGSVEISGTVRVFDSATREAVPLLMERIVKGITEAHGGTYELNYRHGIDPVINDDRLTRLVEQVAVEQLGEVAIRRLKPNMGAEDFSAFQQKAPGTYFFTGAGNAEKGIVYPHHHPRFTIDEDALQNGMKVLLHAALKLLEE